MGKREREYLEYHSTEYIDNLSDGELKEQEIKARAFENMLGRIIQDKTFTNEDICVRAEVIPEALYKYLRGDCLPQPKTAIRLAMALELPLEETNRFLRSANCPIIHDLHREMSIIKKHYKTIIEEFEKHRDNPEYVCNSILELNEELESCGFKKLFESSSRGRISRYEESF